jgi:hypothetical protein
MKTTAEMIEVMQAYLDGRPIEICKLGLTQYEVGIPIWDWVRFDYRISLTKPSIDWAHVAWNYMYMATNDNGITLLFQDKPYIIRSINPTWVSSCAAISVAGFKSFAPGNCDWIDSLVERPKDTQ